MLHRLQPNAVHSRMSADAALQFAWLRRRSWPATWQTPRRWVVISLGQARVRHGVCVSVLACVVLAAAQVRQAETAEMERHAAAAAAVRKVGAVRAVRAAVLVRCLIHQLQPV